MTCVLQPWVCDLTMMQQSVLLGVVRGPDGLPKYGACKNLLRWYRRCILFSAIDGVVLTTPFEPNGGSFTGPSFSSNEVSSVMEGEATWFVPMSNIVSDYLLLLDSIPHHFQLHFMHAVEILGYKRPDHEIRSFWLTTYRRLVHDMHLWPETESQLDLRLGDDREGWLARADEATSS